MNFTPRKRFTEQLKRLLKVLSALNHEVTQLMGKSPVEAINDNLRWLMQRVQPLIQDMLA